MKLSIIIPVFNEEATLREVIKKVRRAKLPVTKEIIVVDDASTDSSGKIIRSLKQCKRFFHERNQGKGAADRKSVV